MQLLSSFWTNWKSNLPMDFLDYGAIIEGIRQNLEIFFFNWFLSLPSRVILNVCVTVHQYFPSYGQISIFITPSDLFYYWGCFQTFLCIKIWYLVDLYISLFVCSFFVCPLVCPLVCMFSPSLFVHLSIHLFVHLLTHYFSMFGQFSCSTQRASKRPTKPTYLRVTQNKIIVESSTSSLFLTL